MQEYSLLCNNHKHIQIDVRVDAQYNMVNFNWYTCQQTTHTQTPYNGKTHKNENENENENRNDSTPIESVIARTVASNVRVLHFSLSEMKKMQPDKLKNEILNRVRAITNNTDKSESSSKYYKSSSTSMEDTLVEDEVEVEDVNDVPNIYCVCRRGNDSILATQLLLQLGFHNVFNVTGGLTAWKDTVDPAFPMY